MAWSGWSDSTWWFHASATDCWSRGRFNDWTTCVDRAPSWNANNVHDFENPPALMELEIPLALLDLATDTATEIGIAFNVTDTADAYEFWPARATMADPSTWARLVVELP